MAGVQIDVVGSGSGHPGDDGLGHDVTRSQVRELVDPRHEPHPVAVHQEGTFAAHGLGEKRLLAARALTQPEDCRVELDELEIRNHCSRPQRRSNTVTGGHRGVRGGRIDLPDPARGQDHGPGPGRANTVVLALTDDVQRHPTHTRIPVLQQVHNQGVLDHLDAWVLLDRDRGRVQRRDQRPRYLLAGRVSARVGDPVAAVSALSGQRDLAVGPTVKQCPQGCELTNTGWTL